jgi:hypothetical protein
MKTNCSLRLLKRPELAGPKKALTLANNLLFGKTNFKKNVSQ